MEESCVFPKVAGVAKLITVVSYSVIVCTY